MPVAHNTDQAWAGAAHQRCGHVRGKVPAFEHNHEAKLHLDPQKVQEDLHGPFRILFRIEPAAWDTEKMDLQCQTDPTGANDRAFNRPFGADKARHKSVPRQQMDPYCSTRS